jgi:signal transduction histidine kinase
LTNVLRHVGPDATVYIRLKQDGDRISVDIRDDGRATGPYVPAQQPGHGVAGMRERVDVHGGSFHAGPHPDGGWRILAEVPCAS